MGRGAFTLKGCLKIRQVINEASVSVEQTQDHRFVSLKTFCGDIGKSPLHRTGKQHLSHSKNQKAELAPDNDMGTSGIAFC